MIHQTFLFYDIETTGLSVAFDQIIQFAAIRTDKALNEISRHEIRIQLRDDIIPSPYAVLTHGVSPQAMRSGETELEGIKKIHALMNEPGTISLGYNTLGFDDEFLRFEFYRHLLTPYTHQYSNHCGRADLYPITLFFYLFQRECGIEWPLKDGQISLKLDALNAQNNLSEGMAHDAMVDVEATLALAKRFSTQETLWHYSLGYFDKKEDQHRSSALELAFPETTLPYTEGIFIHGKLGAQQNFQAPVLCLGQHRHYKNQWIFLRLDLEALRETSIQEPEKTIWTFRKKWGEPGFLLPAKKRFIEKLLPTQLETAHENKKWLQSNPAILQSIVDYALDFKYPLVPEADVETCLYQSGFLSPHDLRLCEKFHAHPIEATVPFIEQFQSSDIQEIAIRLLARYCPKLIPKDWQDRYLQYFNQWQSTETPVLDFRRQAKFNLNDAQREIAALMTIDLNEAQKILLHQYQQYIEKKRGS